MSRDSYGATERWEVLNIGTKTRVAEYLISRVFGPAFSTYNRSVAP
jgi:hypothetical protein